MGAVIPGLGMTLADLKTGKHLPTWLPLQLEGYWHCTEVWLPLADLSALTTAGYAWRPDVQKLTLKVGGHRLLMAVGSEMARLDDEELIHLTGPVLLRQGEIYVPLAAL